MNERQLLIKLKRNYIYDKTTGNFLHKRTYCKATAGHLRKDGYIEVSVGDYPYLAHRLAWLYVTGHWPSEIDHKNGVRSDNSFQNLREATRSQNTGNSHGWSKAKRKYDLPRGVYFNKNDPTRFIARIEINRKCISLGCFKTSEEAAEAYKEAARQHFGEFAK